MTLTQLAQKHNLEPEVVSANSLGEMLLKINRMNKQPGTVYIPDVETAERIGRQLMNDISVELDKLRQQQRKQIIDSRLTFTQMNTTFDV